MEEKNLPRKASARRETISALRLTHGRAVWVLEAMGYGAGIQHQTFNHYIKSLRKLGVPFAGPERAVGSGHLAHYSYDHLMEVSLALALRVYGSIPDAVLVGLIEHRQALYPLYRRALLECDCGLGATVRIRADHDDGFEAHGIYLDLRIAYGDGHAVAFGPPRPVSPIDAARISLEMPLPGRTHPPLNLSAIALALVRNAADAPAIRRGPTDRHVRLQSSRSGRRDQRTNIPGRRSDEPRRNRE